MDSQDTPAPMHTRRHYTEVHAPARRRDHDLRERVEIIKDELHDERLPGECGEAIMLAMGVPADRAQAIANEAIQEGQP